VSPSCPMRKTRIRFFLSEISKRAFHFYKVPSLSGRSFRLGFKLFTVHICHSQSTFSRLRFPNPLVRCVGQPVSKHVSRVHNALRPIHELLVIDRRMRRDDDCSIKAADDLFIPFD
jgi:hypothetical protein